MGTKWIGKKCLTRKNRYDIGESIHFAIELGVSPFSNIIPSFSIG
jgi:hypothetical protein